MQVSLLRSVMSIVMSVPPGIKLGLIPGTGILGARSRWFILACRGVLGAFAMTGGYVALYM